MKTILNTSRRKKIRTRKSLNEIRKRSRRLIYPDTKSKEITGEMVNNQKKKHLVTTNRLTLQMFPNAVRSETVTRFGNEVKRNLNLNLKDLMPERGSLCINSELVDDDKSVNSENSVHNGSDNDEQKSDENNIELESPEVVSGLQRESDIAQSVDHDTHVTSPLTDASGEHCTHDKYYLYEQFMSNLSGYLKHTVASSLLSEDVIENLKGHLLSMKMKSNSNIQLKHKATMSNIHISNVSEDVMVEDPMDYIRLSYSAMQDSPSQQSECTTGTSDGVDSLLHMHSPQLLSSSSRTDISDTPEYIYFPHKLN